MVKRVIISALFLLLILFSLPWVAAGQSTVIDLLGGETVEINCEGNKLVFRRESRTKVLGLCQAENPTPTDTPEPEPSDTPDPEPSDTPDPEPTDDPVADIPLCPDHDPTAWHPLYDAERNCHYDHEHKADPHQVDNIFGPVGALYGGQEISYPWQTFSDAGAENDLKHGGYGWLVRRDQECYSRFEDNCITDFRAQFHAIMGGPGAATRFHSFWLEARGCREDDPGRCGMIRTGGWADYGRLFVDNEHVPLPDDPPAPNGRQRLHYDQIGNENFGSWYGGNQLGFVALQTSRMWGLVNPDNPSELHLFCPDSQCRKNNSTMQAHIIGVTIHPRLDTDGDGFVTYEGYTNRHGEIVEDCTEVGLDCVPLQIIDMPVGRFQYRDDTHGFGNDGGTDYDTSPEGEFWITYPN